MFLCSTFIIDFFYGLYIHTFELGWFRGEETKEKVVAKYIEGLKTGNSQIIKRLVSKSHNADKAIQDKIEKFKEADFSEIKIYFGREPPPLDIEIKDIKLKSGEVVSDKISIEDDCHQYQYPGVIKCKKWYLYDRNWKVGIPTCPFCY